MTVGFERAEIVIGRAVGALSLAGSVGVVPFTRSGESTFSLGAEEIALGSTLVAEGVPEAVAVGVATGRFDVGIAAAGSTDAGGVQPHAARDGLAGNRGSERRRFVSDGAARINTRSRGGGPGAAEI